MAGKKCKRKVRNKSRYRQYFIGGVVSGGLGNIGSILTESMGGEAGLPGGNEGAFDPNAVEGFGNGIKSFAGNAMSNSVANPGSMFSAPDLSESKVIGSRGAAAANVANDVTQAAADLGIPGGKIANMLTGAITNFTQMVKTNKAKRREPRQFLTYDSQFGSGLSNAFGVGAAKYGMPIFAAGGQVPIEAEIDEAIMDGSTGEIESIDHGGTHEQGGSPMMADPGDYVFSERLGYDKEGNVTSNEKEVKESFADRAKKIENKYRYKLKDEIAMASKEKELQNLIMEAEVTRLMKEAKAANTQMKKFGGMIKKYANSGYVDSEFKYGVDFNDLGWDNKYGNFSTKEFQDFIGSEIKDLPILGPPGIDSKFGKYTKQAWDKYGDQFQQYKMHEFNKTAPTEQVNTFSPPSPYNKIGADPDPTVPFDIADPELIERTGTFSYNPTGNNRGSRLTPGDKWQLAGMAPAALDNLIGMFEKTDQISPEYNPEEDAVKRLMANRKFDVRPYLEESRRNYNALRANTRNAGTSFAQQQSLGQNAFSMYDNQLQKLFATADMMNNKYRGEEAQTRFSLGESRKQANVLREQLQTQTEAAKRAYRNALTQNLGEGMTRFGISKNQGLTNKIVLDSLAQLTQDFDFGTLQDIINAAANESTIQMKDTSKSSAKTRQSKK